MNAPASDRLAPSGRAERMEAALRLIAGTKCNNFTTGLGSCFRNGRSAWAYYGAEAACSACIAHEGLQP